MSEYPKVTGSKLMCFGLTLLRDFHQHGGIDRKMWIAHFKLREFPESSAMRAMNDLVRRGLAAKSKDKKRYTATPQGMGYSGHLIQIRPPKGDHKQPKLFNW